MPRRRGRGRRKSFKLKLKKKTIYTIFGIGFFLTGIFLLISFFNPNEATAFIPLQLNEKFGAGAFFAPFVLIFLGFLFLNLKFYLSRINVALGYILIFISFISLLKTGVVGSKIFTILEDIISKPGANTVFIAGLLVGSIVFFDTTIDEIFQGIGAVFSTINKLIPRKIFTVFRRWSPG